MQKKRIITSREIGAKLKELRKSMGVSQEAFAEVLGVTFQQVQRYEKGTNKLNVENIQVVAHALGVPVSAFLPDEGGSFPDKSYLSLSTDEMRLVRLYRQIPDSQTRNLAVQFVKLAAKK
jgi:transcriptional regulator with XRE-family HTH domain